MYTCAGHKWKKLPTIIHRTSEENLWYHLYPQLIHYCSWLHRGNSFTAMYTCAGHKWKKLPTIIHRTSEENLWYHLYPQLIHYCSWLHRGKYNWFHCVVQGDLKFAAQWYRHNVA